MEATLTFLLICLALAAFGLASLTRGADSRTGYTDDHIRDTSR